MTLSREEIQAHNNAAFVALVEREKCPVGADYASWLNGLCVGWRGALGLTPAPVAPTVGKYEPEVGDVVRYLGLSIDYIVTQTNPLGGKYKSSDGGWSDWYGPKALDHKFTYLRDSTDAEKRAAGLSVPPPAPTPAPEAKCEMCGGPHVRDVFHAADLQPPAPEAKRPTHVRVTKIGDVGFDVAEGSVYEVVRWYDDGGGAVSPQVMADNGELVELAYVDHSDADYCPSWEPAPCPPPVAGSAEKDEAFKALLAYAECEEAAWGCGELEPTLVLHGKKRNEHAHEFLKRLRTKALALSRPVRP